MKKVILNLSLNEIVEAEEYSLRDRFSLERQYNRELCQGIVIYRYRFEEFLAKRYPGRDFEEEFEFKAEEINSLFKDFYREGHLYDVISTLSNRSVSLSELHAEMEQSLMEQRTKEQVLTFEKIGSLLQERGSENITVKDFLRSNTDESIDESFIYDSLADLLVKRKETVTLRSVVVLLDEYISNVSDVERRNSIYDIHGINEDLLKLLERLCEPTITPYMIKRINFDGPTTTDRYVVYKGVIYRFFFLWDEKVRSIGFIPTSYDSDGFCVDRVREFIKGNFEFATLLTRVIGNNSPMFGDKKRNGWRIVEESEFDDEDNYYLDLIKKQLGEF